MDAATTTGVTQAGEKDRHRAIRLLEGLQSQHEIRLLVIPGEPPPKHRVRFTSKGHAFTPKQTVAAERYIATHLLAAGIGPYAGNVALVCLFFRSTYQRTDVDNLLKAVLDSATAARVWQDDSQVTALVGVLERDADQPRMVLAFGEHDSTMKRGDSARRTCETCGKRFLAPGRNRMDTARFCSRRCSMTLAEPIPCPHCAVPFKRRNTHSKFCSVGCRSAWHAARAHSRRAEATHCRRGHSLTPENVHVLSNGHRRCRACNASGARDYRQRQAGKGDAP